MLPVSNFLKHKFKKGSMLVIALWFSIILVFNFSFGHRGELNRIYRRAKIVIFNVITDTKKNHEYKLPIGSIRCYAAYHNYEFVRINFEKDLEYAELCISRDFMFRRHCALYHYLKTNPSVDYALVIDGDMMVINPNRRIEEFINENVDVTFYNRLFMYEIMAGSFLVKNSEFTHHFIRHWYEYEFKHPRGYHGTDNGAIQMVFLDLLCNGCSPKTAEVCKYLWETSKKQGDLAQWEACVRSMLGDREYFDSAIPTIPGKARILTDVRNYWARDGWQTNQDWSDNDFILHGWQEHRRYNASTKRGNKSPFLDEHFPLDLCLSKKTNISELWTHKPSNHKPVAEVVKKLMKAGNYSQHLYIRDQENIAEVKHMITTINMKLQKEIRI